MFTLMMMMMMFINCYHCHSARVKPSFGSSTDKSQSSLNQSHDDVNELLDSSTSKSSQGRSIPSVGTGAGQIFCDIGRYKGEIVAIKHIKKDHIWITHQVLLEFNQVIISGLTLRCIYTEARKKATLGRFRVVLLFFGVYL